MTKKKQEPKRTVLADELKQGTLGHHVNELPNKLVQNIQSNLYHQLRLYQWRALENFNWSQHQPDADKRFNQVMFKMATGSGKTDLMAALILYLYATKGYQYFIYVTYSRGVVNKTKDNFLHPNSDKYLFSRRHNINIKGLDINIKGDFPDSLNNPQQGMIYIKPITIQGLVNQLNGGDNTFSYRDFEKHRVIILADEAHHFNVTTKQSKSKRKSRKVERRESWEDALNGIRQGDSNPDVNKPTKNRQLEFTATLDYQHDDHLYKKYKDKIIYEYSLRTFINPNDSVLVNGGKGYAKQIYRLETPDNDHIKMINALLLSQYRKAKAEEFGILNFKPVILFKSNRVSYSRDAANKFNGLISSLTTQGLLNDIQDYQRTAHSSILQNYVYKYWIKRLNEDLEHNKQTVVSHLKNDFQPTRVVDMNDSRKDVLSDDNNFSKVNSLESPDNKIRAIFAVAKLTEGWDVLNLYDIVRLKEHKKNITKKDTDSEAQLIGRGSRYYPFTYNHHKVYYRRFDKFDIPHQVLERLYYHTINDNDYLDKLDRSLHAKGVAIHDDNNIKPVTAHLKDHFKGSNVYKYGYLFQNETVSKTPRDMTSFKKCGIQTGECLINFQSGTYEHEEFVKNNVNSQSIIDTRPVIDKGNHYLSDDPQLVKVAMDKLYYFFNFKNLKHDLPELNSLHEFITSSKWLGSIKLMANIDSGSLAFTAKQRHDNYFKYRHEQLKAVVQYFDNQLLTQIRNARKIKKGTNIFKPRQIKEIIPDSYTREVRINHQNDKGWLAHTEEHPMNQSGTGWFVYDNAIVDNLEYKCIEAIGRQVPHWHQYYNRVFLIRNDEQYTKLKLHSFTDTQHEQGYLPDFVLYLSKKGNPQNLVYQIYIEPKGPQLVERDEWKEQLLTSIYPDNIEPKPIEINTSSRHSRVKLYGVPFYVDTYSGSRWDKFDTHRMFKKLNEIIDKKN